MSIKKTLVIAITLLSIHSVFAQDEDHSFYAGIGLGAGIPLGPFNSRTLDPSGGGSAKLGFDGNVVAGYQVPGKAYGGVLTIGYNLNKFDINGLAAAYPDDNITAGTSGSYSILTVMLGPSIGDKNDKLSYNLGLQLGYVSVSYPALTYSTTAQGSGKTTSYAIGAVSSGSLGFQVCTSFRYSITDNLCALFMANAFYGKPTGTYTETTLTTGSQAVTGPVTFSRYVVMLNFNIGVAYAL
ncbi:MAG TPA: hypothetical protein VK806_13710 [Bacteroidia bacterium]|jgi:hypothetical protein|nr:hypothetical protein [Bacteroidia bacterium]